MNPDDRIGKRLAGPHAFTRARARASSLSVANCVVKTSITVDCSARIERETGSSDAVALRQQHHVSYFAVTVRVGWEGAGPLAVPGCGAGSGGTMGTRSFGSGGVAGADASRG